MRWLWILLLVLMCSSIAWAKYRPTTRRLDYYEDGSGVLLIGNVVTFNGDIVTFGGNVVTYSGIHGYYITYPGD